MKDSTVGLLVFIVLLFGVIAIICWGVSVQSVELEKLKFEKIRDPFSHFVARTFDGQRLISRNDKPLQWHIVCPSGNIIPIDTETDAMMKLWDEMAEDMNTKNVDFEFWKEHVWGPIKNRKRKTK